MDAVERVLRGETAGNLGRHDHAIEVYGIPREVLVRVGGAPPSMAPTQEDP